MGVGWRAEAPPPPPLSPTGCALSQVLLRLARMAGVRVRLLELPNVRGLPADVLDDATAVVTPSRFCATHGHLARHMRRHEAARRPPLHVIAPVVVSNDQEAATHEPQAAGQSAAQALGAIMHAGSHVGTVLRLSVERSPGLFVHVAAAVSRALPRRPPRFTVVGGGVLQSGLEASDSAMAPGSIAPSDSSVAPASPHTPAPSARCIAPDPPPALQCVQ